VPDDAEILLWLVWMRETATNDPLVSGQQLAASSDEESSGSAIVFGALSEFDFATDSLRSECRRALQQAWPFNAISDFAFVDVVCEVEAPVRIAMP